MANRKITYEVGFTGNTSQLQAALRQAVASLQELGTRPQNLQRGLEGAAHAALELNNHLRNAYNVDTGKLDLTRFRQELDKGGKSLEDYANELRRLGPEGEQAFMQVATAIGAAELPLKRSNQLLNQLWITMKNTARWRLTTGALNAFIGGLQQAFGYSKSLNASLNDIRIVTGKSADEMARFAKEANQAAKELSTTTTTYTDASLIYYQQGLDSEAVKERTDATIKMSNVTGQSAETISSQMTAVWNNFREGSRTLESYADTMVALGASTASSSKEIAEGLEKFAPIANSVGLSFDYASAALATLVATTRESASVAGNALKTLFSRLEGLKLGETLDDGTDLNKYSQALYTVGINIKDANGELKDMDVILTELGNRWKDLARDEQMALAQTVGGVRQYAQLVALMDNWQVFQQNLTTARTAEGSLEKQAQIYAESWEAARDRVKAATEDVYDSLINPKVFIDLDKMAQAVLKPLASVLDAVGGLTGLLPIVAALMTKVYSTQIANVMRDMAVNIGLMTGQEQERARAIQATFAAETEKLEFNYRDDQFMAARVSILKEQVGLQGDINSKADQYSEYQMAQIKNASYIAELLKKQALAQTDIAEQAQKALDEKQTDIRYSISLPKFDTYEAEQSFIKLFTNLSQKTQNIVNEIIGDVVVPGGNLTRVFTVLDQGFESVMQRSAQIETLRHALSDVDNVSGDWGEHIKELATNLGLVQQEGESNIDFFNRLKQVVSQTGEATSEVDSDIRNLQAILKALGADNNIISSYTFRMRDLQRQLESQKITQEEYRKEVERIHNELKNGIKDQQDWASSFVAVANGASQAAVGIRAVTNIYETFTDETLSASEKLTRSITSLTMLLPTATTLMKGFAAGASAAQAATSWTMVAVIAIVGIIKILDALIVTQKEAAQSIQESIDKYKEAEQELQSLQGELKTTQDRIKELQDLAASGSISIVEQEELKNLQIENDKLERQLELKKELARIEFKETLNEYQKSGAIAYAVPEKSYSDTYKDILDTLPIPIYTQTDAYNKSRLVDYLTKQEGTLNLEQLPDDLKQYKDILINVYDDIEAIREQHNSEWLQEVGDSLSQAETLYGSFLDNLEEVSSSDLRNLQQQLANLRKAFYGDKYKEKIIDPLLNNIVSEDLNRLKGIYETNGAVPEFFKGISQTTKDLLVQYGITAQEAGERVVAITDQAREKLKQFGLSDMVNDFSYVELKLIASADEEFTNFEQLLNYIKANAGIIPVSLQIQVIEDARLEALERLASGEMLDEELIAKLQEAYQGIADLADFSNRSVTEQIKFLTTEGKVAEAKLKDLQEQKNAVITDLRTIEEAFQQAKEKLEIGKGQKLYTAKIALEADLQDITSEIEKLKEQMEKEPWQIQIEMSNEIAAQLNNVKKAIALINEDLSVSAENVVELGKRYPEALVGATYDASNNILKIEEEKYNALTQMVAESVQNNLDYKRDEAAGWLTAQANVAAGIIQIVNETQEEERNQDKETLKAQLKNDQKTLKSAQDLATSTMIAVVKSEADKRQQQLDTMVGSVSSAQTAADSLGRNAEITTENYSTAAQKILESFDTMFRQIAIGAAIITDPTKQYIPISTNVWRSFEAKPGESINDTWEKNVSAARNNDDYKKADAELKRLNLLTTALEKFQKEEIPWDQVKSVFRAIMLDSADIDYFQDTFSQNFQDFFAKDFNIDDVDSLIDELDEWLTEDPLALSELQKILDDTLNSLQYLLEEPEKITAGKVTEPKEEKDKKRKLDEVKLEKAELEAEADTLADIEDRYHEITREIERQGRILSVLENQIERTYGLDRLDLYEQKIKELNQLQQDQISKSNRASRYLKETDRPRLDEALKATNYDKEFNKILEKYGVKFAGSKDISLSINPDTREIQDFEKLQQDIVDESQEFMNAYHSFMVDYNEFLEGYNQFNEAYENMTEDEYNALSDEQKRILLTQMENYKIAAENRKAEYELVQSQYELTKTQQEERLEAISQYEKTLDVINTLAHEIEDTARKIEDAKLNAITYRMSVILDVREARKQIRDFSKQIAESFGDALTHGVQSASLGWDQARDEMAMYKEYVKEYNDLKDLLDNANEFTDTTAIIAELKDLEGNIIDSGQRLLEWTEQIEDMFANALSAAADRFSYFTNQLEHNDAILTTMKELYALQGQTYKTQQGFDRLQRVAQEKLEAQVGQAKLQRKWFEEADARLKEAEAQFDALIAEKGAEAEQDFRYDTLKKNRDALLAEQQEAQKQMLNAAQQAMETAQQMYLDQIEKATYEFGKSLSGGLGLDLLQEKYDHYIETEERYLDKVNEAYEVAAWYDKLQQDIDNTSDKYAKERLKTLQKEIDIRRENNTLSKYDLDILEAKYKVTKAQMELEEAQNNKNQLRLVRDSQGNWNYQFTTNPDEIANKEQQVLEAEKEWYNIAKEQTKEITGEIISTWQECQEEINKIYSDTNNFVMNEETGRLELTQEAQEKEIEIRKFYADKVAYLEEEKQIAIKDMTEAGNQAMLHLAISAGDQVADLTGITGEKIQGLVETTGLEAQKLMSLSFEQIQDVLESKLQELANSLGISVDQLRNILNQKNAVITEDIGDNANEVQNILQRRLAEIARELGTDVETLTSDLLKISAGTTTGLTNDADTLKKIFSSLSEELGISTQSLQNLLAQRSSNIVDDISPKFQRIFDSANSATTDLFNLFDENWGLIKDIVGETSGSFGDASDSIIGDFGDMSSSMTNFGTTAHLFDNSYAADLANMTSATSKFEEHFDKAIEIMQDSFEDYGDTIETVAEDTGTSFNNLDDWVNIVADSTDRIVTQGYYAADALWIQMDAAYDAQMGYLELASAVWEYIYALQALALEDVVPTIQTASKTDTFDEDNLFKPYDPNTDWSIEMGKAAKAGDWVAVTEYGKYRERKFDEGGFDRSNAVSTEDLENSLIKAYKEGNDDLKQSLEEVLAGEKYYRDVIPIASAATGMYTGDFDNGRLAVLHEKELVLNQEDTRNILDAVQIVRNMQDSLFGDIAKQLDNEGFAAMGLLSQRIGGIGLPTVADTSLDQHVTIEHVSFPGVTSSREIEEAFENIVNDAAQWARRRKS